MTKFAPALLVYEDADKRPLLRTAFSAENCEVDEVAFHPQAKACPSQRYSFVLFSVRRPTRILLEVLRAWHDTAPEATLLVVGNQTAEVNRLAVLEAGVDAYLSEPVSAVELAARVRAALRRPRPQDHPVHQLSFGTTIIDLKAHLIRTGARHVRLTQTECGILKHFAAHPNRTVPCTELVQFLWGTDPRKGPHSLRFFIRKLRQKLEPDPGHPRYLLTDPTNGYRLQLSGVASGGFRLPRRPNTTPGNHASPQVLGNVGEMSLIQLRMAIRSNRISFPAQTPIFSCQPKAQIQWRLAALFFIHGWPCADLALRYGFSVRYAQQLVSQWAKRAVALGYLQEIPVPEASADRPGGAAQLSLSISNSSSCSVSCN